MHQLGMHHLPPPCLLLTCCTAARLCSCALLRCCCWRAAVCSIRCCCCAAYICCRYWAAVLGCRWRACCITCVKGKSPVSHSRSWSTSFIVSTGTNPTPTAPNQPAYVHCQPSPATSTAHWTKPNNQYPHQMPTEYVQQGPCFKVP